jgi:hypothetical protein
LWLSSGAYPRVEHLIGASLIGRLRPYSLTLLYLAGWACQGQAY